MCVPTLLCHHRWFCQLCTYLPLFPAGVASKAQQIKQSQETYNKKEQGNLKRNKRKQKRNKINRTKRNETGLNSKRTKKKEPKTKPREQHRNEERPKTAYHHKKKLYRYVITVCIDYNRIKIELN